MKDILHCLNSSSRNHKTSDSSAMPALASHWKRSFTTWCSEIHERRWCIKRENISQVCARSALKSKAAGTAHHAVDWRESSGLEKAKQCFRAQSRGCGRAPPAGAQIQTPGPWAWHSPAPAAAGAPRPLRAVRWTLLSHRRSWDPTFWHTSSQN